MMLEMPQYEFRIHDKSDWEEISEIELMDGLYRIYKKVTPAIKEMIMGKEVKTPDGIYRLKIQEETKLSEQKFKVCPMQIQCKSCQSSTRIDVRLLKPNGTNVKCSKCQHVFKIFPSHLVNLRKYPRIKTSNMISHVTVDEHGKWISQGLGKALDISKGGILLETPQPIESGLVSLMAVDLNNNIIEIKGELVYCKKTASGMYHSGIKFVGTNEQLANFAIRLIKEYNYRRKNLRDSQTR